MEWCWKQDSMKMGKNMQWHWNWDSMQDDLMHKIVLPI
jgi:hypothetical protein